MQRYGASSPLSVLVTASIALGCILPQIALGQRSTPSKLTFSQVEELVLHQVPDSTLHSAILTRGLAFTPSTSMIETLRAKGAGPMVLSDLRDRISGLDLPNRPMPPRSGVNPLVKGEPPKVTKTIRGCLALNLTGAQLSAISKFQDRHPQFVRYDFGPNEYADGSCLDTSQQWQMSDGDEVAQYPFAAWGDFNHDGFLDLALFFVGKMPALTHKWPMNGNFVYTYEYDWLIVVFHGSQDGSYAPVVAGRDRWANAMDGVIFHRGRGRIEYWFKSAGGSVKWTGSGYRIEPMKSED
jgi:hypothetical protein